MPANTLKLILGGSHIYNWSADDKEEYVRIMQKHGVVDVDTAAIYDRSEGVIGALADRESLRVHTKTAGFITGMLAKENILRAAKESLGHLKHIDAYMFQSPDPETPIAESLEVIDQLHSEGAFMSFGLSNFSAEEVQEVYDICKAKGYILPTTYSGSYNAVTRGNEEDLFPTLRRLGISFWAYSPIGAGFLTKRFEDFNLPGNEGYGPGRFSQESGWSSSISNAIYNRPKLLESLKLWNDIASKEGVAPAELAARWIAHHSVLKPELGDGIILGASKPAQLDQTIEYIKKGLLSQEAVDGNENVWTIAKEDATGKPLFS
ncbi:hypothetical protein KVT40_002454 [Elsinoe batatas]|uniref:NADP-dependent oxidoreductase domain-containing protein n=1 Tax=Elsinoe batatas TaxID=2601811 RepID=A0A8K0LB43_9PEZI|nr:hypothetical protein KVT40_002454 [Elsinoe batatas]